MYDNGNVELDLTGASPGFTTKSHLVKIRRASRDQFEDNWLALYIAIYFYRDLTSEQAFKLLRGNTKMRRMCRRLTPEIVQAIKKTTSSYGFSNYERVAIKYGISVEEIKKIEEG